MDLNMERQVVNTTLAPTPMAGTVHCVRAQGLFAFTSAVNGRNPETDELPPDFPTQMRNMMYNARAILEASRSDLYSSILVMIDLADAHYELKLYEIYKAFFATNDPPALRLAIVSSLPEGALVQMTIIAGAREGI